MINKTKLLSVFITLLAIFPAVVISGQSQPSRAFEEKGQEILHQASEKLRSFNTVRIEFSYVMENSNQHIHEVMEGILVSKGEKYHMQVGENVFISDGTTVWAYMEDLDEVHINLVENTDGSMTPTAILEEFDTQFKATFIRQEQHNGKFVDIIDLAPNTPQVFFKYRLAIDARERLMVYAIAYDRHGGTYTYNINRFETNRPVSDNLFTFSVTDFPGVEVIDLR